MSTNLATVDKRAELAKAMPEFSNEQIRILGETVAKGCDQNELAFFLQVAKLKRLDPFTGQIHVVKRWDSGLGKEKMTVQTGIDGYRVIASRTRDLAGTDDAIYDSEDGEHPNWAKVTVYRYGRNDDRIPYTATARWNEYVQMYKDKQTGEQRPNRMWKTMPFLMLGKVAEALALRKAFPDELSGVYTNEEMDQADAGTTPASVGKPPVSMPKSTDEKKLAATTQKPTQTEPPKAQTTSTANPAPAPAGEPEELSGEIVSVTPGKNGVVVLNVKGFVVVVPAKFASDDLMVGAKILCSVLKVKIKGNNCLEVSDMKMVSPPILEGEVIDGEYADVDEKVGTTDPVLDEARAAGLSGLFDENPKPKPQTTMEPAQPTTEAGADKPGTAGMKRARRLHTLITQNWKNVGFTEELLKKYLATQRLEHARDLACPPKGSDAFNAYEYACSMAVGEIDYKDILDD
jgi:phage recombination protein Bet